MAAKSNFLDKVLGRIGRLDAQGLQTVVRRLARERDFLETLFNTIEDGVLVLDESGRILYFNQAVTKLLGLQPGAEGQLIERYLPEFEWQKLAALDRAGGPGVARHEFEVHYPRPRVISLYAAPLDGEATGSSGLALILHDATEARLKTFEAIESERMQALTLLAASVAHEIGNPLNALHIHLQLIERELRKLRARDTEKIQSYVGVAKGEIARLDYIVRQFLQAIRPTIPKLTLSSLNDAVRATIELLRPEIENRGIVLEQKLARQLPEVRLDPAQIQQALVNLVRNALQAMTKGGVLRLQTGQSSENVWVSVADDGCGIPADHVKRIFEPFYTTKKKGSGLGLMIVQRIVRDHGGGIELESRVGQGTQFPDLVALARTRPQIALGGQCMNKVTDQPTLLIVDDEKPTREGLRAALEDRYDVYVAEDAATAMLLLEKEHFDVLLTDFRLPADDGMKLIARAKSLSKPPICILMTAYGSEELAVQAMKNGADDYVAKGRMQIDELEMRIARILRQQKLEVENVSLRQQLDSKFGLESIIGQSPPMIEVFEVVRQVAPARATVLITGESGTGKELIAKAIHQLSPRHHQPMVTVHCAGLPPTLIESELFGHEKGAFTGAHERKIGRIEHAQGGTLFLDEIAEIDAAIQIKLLRFLGERTFERVGSAKTQSADVRLIAATNKRLEDLVAAGQFRDDLYFRLKGVRIELPPLRDRRADIPMLAQTFVRESARENDKAVHEITPDAMERLLNYSWPGNVRELRSAIETAVVLCRSDRITVRELPAEIRVGVSAIPSPARPAAVARSGLVVKDAEKELIIRALKESAQNRTEAAKKLGMSRRTLHRKLHTYKLEDI